MCLYKLKSQPLKPKVAKDRIKIYKVLVKPKTNIQELRSPFRHVSYNIGSTYSSELGIPWYDELEKQYLIFKGLHAFVSLEGAKKMIKGHTEFLALNNLKKEFVIVEGYIKKGVEYHLGYNKEIVCQKFKLTKIVT